MLISAGISSNMAAYDMAYGHGGKYGVNIIAYRGMARENRGSSAAWRGGNQTAKEKRVNGVSMRARKRNNISAITAKRNGEENLQRHGVTA